MPTIKDMLDAWANGEVGDSFESKQKWFEEQKRKEINQNVVKVEQNPLFILREIADEVESILRSYLDMREDYYKLVATWIIGCYLHNNFTTYPYLFLNAMRGSGKSRALKVITALGDGEMLISLKEAVLFRYPKNKLLVIDEFEGLNSKDNCGLREILNASYKKGMGIMRNKKIKTPNGEDYILEKFEPYKPVAMANIWGMEEVLGDRSITLILEKSSKSEFNMILEDFDSNPRLQDIKVRIKQILVQLCSYFGVGGTIQAWNKWVKYTYNYTTTYTTYTTLTTLSTLNQNELENEKEEFFSMKNLDRNMFFESIARTGINGRNLELFMPLLLIAKQLGESWLNHILKLSETMIKERKMEEMTQSKDVSVYDFVSKQLNGGWEGVKPLASRFREFIAVDSEEDNWVNAKWLGRALLRLNLILEKRRLGKGVEVILNAEKAREKLKMFQMKEGTP